MPSICRQLPTMIFMAALLFGCQESPNSTQNSWSNKDIFSLVIASLAFVISAFTFYFSFFQRGKLKFRLPNVTVFKGSEKGKGNVFIILPISATNTGAVTHTINYLEIRLKSKSGSQEYNFPMNSELDSIPPQKDPEIATSFSVSPRSSISKIISFSSFNPGIIILPGSYELAVWVWIDGGVPSKPRLVFETELDTNQVDSINSGQYARLRSPYT